MDSRCRQCTRLAASSSASLHLTPLVCRSPQNVDRCRVFLLFSCHRLVPVSSLVHCELGVLVLSGVRVPQTGISSLLRCLAVASVQFVSIHLCLLPCPSRVASSCCGRVSDSRPRGRGFESRPGTTA